MMRRSSLCETAGGSELGVPMAGVLGGALLGAEVHVGEAEALRIAFGPFEIVHEAPVMISADVGAVEHGAAERVQVAAQELDAAFIGDVAVFVGGIEIGATVLGDFQGRGFVFVGNAQEEIVEAVGPDFPGKSVSGPSWASELWTPVASSPAPGGMAETSFLLGYGVRAFEWGVSGRRPNSMSRRMR